MLRTASVLAIAISLAFLVLADIPGASKAHANGILVSNPEAVTPIGPRPGGRRPTPMHLRAPVVRLKGHRVKADVSDRIASVTVEQVFHNHGHRQLEGTYLFPLPEGAIISQLRHDHGSARWFEGEIIEREQGTPASTRASWARRRDPGLLEYMGRGLFRARVFPIMPRSDLTIQLTYQQVLPDDEGTVEFRYPLATDRMNASAVQSVSIDIRVKSSVDIKTLYSPSHGVEVKREGERSARVSYERSNRRQDKDLLLYIGRSPDAIGFSLQSHKQPGIDGTFMSVFAPRTKVEDADRVPKDVVYVIDKSGSMAGPHMEQAQKAVSYGVRLLRKGDRFNVVGFSTNLYPFRDVLQPATTEMKEAAVKYVEGLTPSGGTNINGALQQALSMRKDDRLFMVVFITDGKPTVDVVDPQTIVENVKANNRSNTRIFTFGVGLDLDVTLLDRIAETTNGARDYVTHGEDIEIVTSRFFRKVDQPVLTDLRVEFGAGVTDVYPQRLPDLFAGGQIVLFGRYKEAGARTVILRGKRGTKEIVFEHNAKLTKSDGASYLPRLWAHRKVAYLLDEIRLHGQNKELVDEVVRLATRYAIVTPYTAGLVVEESELQGLPADRRSARVRRGRLWDQNGRFGLPGGSSPGVGGGGGRTGGPPPPRAGAMPTPSPNTPSAPAAEAKGAATRASEGLKKMKDGASDDAADGKRRDGLDDVRALVRSVEGKTFLKGADGRWTDKLWDGKKATTKVEAFSPAYFELLAKSDKIARYLALGERVVFVLGDTLAGSTVYEIIPAK